MDLTHRLRVPAPLDEAWAAVNDPARVAAVLPGSTVASVADDTFTGTIKIKLGSSLLVLAGSGRYVSRDAGAHRVVVASTGSDRRGDAGVEATHTISLAVADGSAAETDVTVSSSMTWSGRPSRLGEGVVADAVDHVLEQTGSRIAARVAEGLSWVPVAGEAGVATPSAEMVVDHPVELGDDLGDLDEPDRSGSSGQPAPSPSPGPSPRPAEPPQPREYVYRPFDNAAEPHLDAARAFGQVVLRRLLPYTGLAALAAFAAASVVRRVRR